MAIQELETRVSKAEWTLQLHDSELTELKDSSDDLRLALKSIQTTLSQIKWVAIGVGLAYFSQQLGLPGIISLLK